MFSVPMASIEISATLTTPVARFDHADADTAPQWLENLLSFVGALIGGLIAWLTKQGYALYHRTRISREIEPENL